MNKIIPSYHFDMLIYAPNIHQGGGKVLLLDVLKNHENIEQLICDSRLNLEQTSINCKIIRINPNIFSRLFSEFIIYKAAKKNSEVLCFSNLPPLFPLKSKVHLFFQNTLILGKHKKFKLNLRSTLKKIIELSWLKIGIKNVDHVYIQSESLADKFQKCFPKTSIKIVPFTPINLKADKSFNHQSDFLYIASGDPHKNHENLLAAWELLAQENLYPELTLTVDKKYTLLIEKIRNLKKRNIKITNFSSLSHDKALSLYTTSKALIYPSFTESFGLPLIEAQHFNLPIIAAELDYVRDFSTPTETFDPESPRSIARAVKRFLKIENNKQTQKLYSTQDFLTVLKKETTV